MQQVMLVTLEAVARTSWLFVVGPGAVDGNQNPVTVTMDADKTSHCYLRPGGRQWSSCRDNFDGCSLDSELSTFVDPLGDATLSTNGDPALHALSVLR